MTENRLAYDLRVQIGRALDRLVCDDSTPEQVDQFIATFAHFGLKISADDDFGPSPSVQTNVTGWLPIDQADKGIAYIHAFGPIQVGNSYPVWARDADGRVFECLWADDGKRAYWWDSEAESPVDPVEFMPHPLDPRFATTTEGE